MKNINYAINVFNVFVRSYKDDYKIVALESLKYDTALQNELKTSLGTDNFDSLVEFYYNDLIKTDLLDKKFTEDEINSILDMSLPISDQLIYKMLYYQLALIHDIDSVDDIRAGLSNAGYDPFQLSKDDWNNIYNMKNVIDF